MCAGCISSRSYQSKDVDAKPFLPTKNGSMGDDGVAIKDDEKYDGDSGQSKKFEGMGPSKGTGAKEAQNTGRQ
jgi:hypothetical protein